MDSSEQPKSNLHKTLLCFDLLEHEVPVGNIHCGDCARRITTSGLSNLRVETDGDFMKKELWLFC